MRHERVLGYGEVRAGPALLLGALMWAGAARSAAAQDQQSAAVLGTTATEGVEPDVAASFDRLIRSRVEAHGGLRLQGSVALGLEDVQPAPRQDRVSPSHPSAS